MARRGRPPKLSPQQAYQRGRVSAGAAITLIGDKELAATLQGLTLEAMKKVMVPAARKAMTEAIPYVQALTPVDDNPKPGRPITLRGGKYERKAAMRDAIKVGSSKPSKKNRGAVAKLYFDTRDPYVAAQAMMLEFGTQERQTKNGYNRGRIAPIGFLAEGMSRAFVHVKRRLAIEARRNLERLIMKSVRQERRRARQAARGGAQ